MSHYVDNKKLYAEMLHYIAIYNEAKLQNSEKPKVPEYVGLCIYHIANRLATKPNFSGYTYKEEMIGDGIENCLMYLHNFDPDKSNNPFAYFTQIIYYAFLRRIQKEKKQLYIKHKFLENAIVENSLLDLPAEDLAYFANLQSSMTDKISDLTDKFEQKEEDGVKKEKIKGIEKFIEEVIIDEDDTEN